MPGRPARTYIQDGFYGATEIARLCGVSLATVLRWVGEGKFGEVKRVPQEPKRKLYDKAKVDAFYAEYRPPAGTLERKIEMIGLGEKSFGSLTARVFKMVKEGHSYHDIVIELQADPSLVRKAMIEYERDETWDERKAKEREEKLQAREEALSHYREKRQEKYWERRTEFEANKIKIEAKQKARSESSAPRTRVAVPEILTRKA